jgi:hypothetical protein
VSSFQFLLVIASAAFLRSESHVTHEHILLSLLLRLPQGGGPGPGIYIPPKTGWPIYKPRQWVPFSSPLTTRRAKVEVF